MAATTLSGGVATPAVPKRANPGALVTVGCWLQLAAFTALTYVFRLESDHLFRICAVAAGGFVIHRLVSPSWRHWVFLLMGLVAGAVTLGPLETAAIALGAVLVIGVARLPISVRMRAAGLILLMGALAASRALRLRPPSFGLNFWAICGSIFAFRALMFFYDTATRNRKSSLQQQLSYFLLFPNFAMPLFPLIDFQTFATRYVDEPTVEDFERGGRMLLAGFAHLIGYRLVFHYADIDVAHALPHQRLFWLASFYLLYLRVSGLFHVVIGLLCFFGYRLPAAHDRHLLSQSFADSWRRTNVYWTMFNQKYVFQPLAMAFQRRVPRLSLYLATFVSVCVSCVIHSYQWFFLRGRPLIDVKDICFWLAIAVCTTASIALEQRVRRKTRLEHEKKPRPLLVAAKTIGFFMTISTLWSIWGAASLSEWMLAVGFRGGTP